MDQIIIAFGVAGVMLAIGIVLRAKTKFFQNILMPAPVIGGIIGLVLVNLLVDHIDFVSTGDFASIVDTFFVLSFITVGLSNKPSDQKSKEEKKANKKNSVVSGAINLGLVWCAIYGIQAFVGGALCELFGKIFDISGMYGILLSFGFSQGPGQAATYGQIFENTYGYQGAEMVAITFAVVGFLAAFLIGVPVARFGLKKKLSTMSGEIGAVEKRGYYKPGEDRRSLGRTTTYGGNIETLTTHFAFVGIAYLLALVFAYGISFIPGIGETFAAMKFFWGMIAGTIIRTVLRKWKLDYILDDMLLSRITAFLTDFVVVTAFMSVELSVLGSLLLPIVMVGTVATLVTFALCVFFCQRMGSDHDFEKLLGLFGTSTGTVSSGISLIRIVDPMLLTTTAQELGCINIVGILSAPIIALATIAGTGKISVEVALIGFLISAVVDILILTVSGGLQKKVSFSFKEQNISLDSAGL